MRFENRVAIITGGTRGIGVAVSRLFTAEGGTVVAVARDATHGEAAVAGIPRASFMAADVRLAADCERVVRETVRTHSRLDVLINNAGVIYRNRTVEQTTDEEWDTTFDINVKGAFLMSRSALQALRDVSGTIVNVASYVGLVGFAGAAAYAASKAALVNLTQTMALDHAREGVRVNCVCPGSVDTEMIRSAWSAHENPLEAKRLWGEKHPLGRIATPEEVARTMLFLASDDASFITGAALPVDGGITAG